MRIAICWTELTGYTTACWRALAARKDVELFVIAHRGGGSTSTFDADSLMKGIPSLVLTPEEATDVDRLHSALKEFNPDGVMFCGWLFKPYIDLMFRLPKTLPVATCLNNAWQGTLRQRLAPIVRRRLLRRFNRIMVTNERSFQLAHNLGFTEAQISRGMNGFGYRAHADATAQRAALGDWPKKFLYVGQYIERKAVHLLLDGYEAYRTQSENPWSLTCCGRGPLKPRIDAAPGVEDLGFIQPPELPAVMAQHGTLILPSFYDTWGVVIAEAAASGMPVIATERCGVQIDVIRPYYNGLVIPTGDTRAISQALLWMDTHYDRLPTMGARARPFAEAFGEEAWADRWEAFFSTLVDESTAALTS